jgi:hypothetical protein
VTFSEMIIVRRTIQEAWSRTVEEPTSTQVTIYWRKLLHTGQDTRSYCDP